MIRQPLEELGPIPSLPEAEALHFGVIVTHGCVAVWCAMQVKINQLLQVRADDLIGVNEDDFLQVHREQHVEEQYFVRPNNSLFFLLSTQPRRPLVSHELVLESILLGKVRNKFLLNGHVPVSKIATEMNTYQERWRQEVFDEPELNRAVGIPKHA